MRQYRVNAQCPFLLLPLLFFCHDITAGLLDKVIPHIRHCGVAVRMECLFRPLQDAFYAHLFLYTKGNDGFAFDAAYGKKARIYPCFPAFLLHNLLNLF